MTTAAAVAPAPFSVGLDARDPAASAELMTTLASVPVRFRVTDRAAPDVQVISGAKPGWIDRLEAAVAARPRAVVITDPAAASADGLQDLARRASSAGTLVGVDIGFAADRAWRGVLDQVREDVAASLLLDSVVETPRSGGAAVLLAARVAQLAVVRQLLGSLDHLHLAHQSDTQYVATGQAGSLPVSLTGTVSPRGSRGLRLDLVGPRHRWRVRLNADVIARPGEIVRYGAERARSQARLFESPRRAVWLDLHAALVSDNACLAYTLEELSEDLALAARLETGAPSPMTRTSA